MPRSFWVLLGLAFASTAFADCAPPNLIRFVTKNASPGVPPDSFQAQPKIQYRLGNGRSRLEEKPDPQTGEHLLFIVDAPKAWQIDLARKTGVVVVDNSDPPLLSMPVFSDEEVPAEIQDALQFGCEDQFIARPDTTHESREIGGNPVVKHSWISGDWKVSLSTREGNRPFGAVLSYKGKVVGAIGYLAYEALAVVPDGLFAPPAGIKIESAL
jgi:hypothetical protein